MLGMKGRQRATSLASFCGRLTVIYGTVPNSLADSILLKYCTHLSRRSRDALILPSWIGVLHLPAFARASWSKGSCPIIHRRLLEDEAALLAIVPIRFFSLACRTANLETHYSRPISAAG
jgi:hypothetical protein